MSSAMDSSCRRSASGSCPLLVARLALRVMRKVAKRVATGASTALLRAFQNRLLWFRVPASQAPW